VSGSAFKARSHKPASSGILHRNQFPSVVRAELLR
jgi:hypothetical protein